MTYFEAGEQKVDQGHSDYIFYFGYAQPTKSEQVFGDASELANLNGRFLNH